MSFWAWVWLQVQIFAIGDAGALTKRQLRLYQTHWQALAKKDDILIWLGDNVYPKGHTGRGRAKRRWDRLVAVSKAFPGLVLIAPGNHDWKAGIAGLLRQEKDLPHYPAPGQLGPAALLKPPYFFIFIDSELYIQTAGKGFSWRVLDSLWQATPDSLQLIIVLHHPPITAGAHGGKFPLMAHLFPLRILSPYAYVPLPGLGTLFILARKAARHPTDLSYPLYQALSDSLKGRAQHSPRPVVFLSGHDHNLQLHQYGQGLFIISGSGCKTEPVARRSAQWAKAIVGYWIGTPTTWQAIALKPNPKKLYTSSQALLF